MDVTDLIPQLDKLDTDIDDLEDVLKPLLKLGEVSSRLPLLDKAKLLVLSSYAIESMLFSALRLNGVDAKEHPVFKELTRVRQYFAKIDKIEHPPAPCENSLDTRAAIRFLRADLADNAEVKSKLTEQLNKEHSKKRPAGDAAAGPATFDGSSEQAGKSAKRPRHARSKKRS